MIRKIKIAPLLTVMFLLIFFSSCEKDAITVETEKSYAQPRTGPEGEWYTGMSLTLKPNGKATLIEGGDMATDGRYDIKGKKINFNGGLFNKYQFTIISEQEIQTESGLSLFLMEK